MPIKLINVNIMSQLTSRGLDNTSSAFVSDIYMQDREYFDREVILRNFN